MNSPTEKKINNQNAINYSNNKSKFEELKKSTYSLAIPITIFLKEMQKLKNNASDRDENSNGFNKEFAEIYLRVTEVIQLILDAKKEGRLTDKNASEQLKKVVNSKIGGIESYINFSIFERSIKAKILKALGNLWIGIGKIFPFLIRPGYDLIHLGFDKSSECFDLKFAQHNVNDFFNNAFNKHCLNVEDFIKSDDDSLSAKKR